MIHKIRLITYIILLYSICSAQVNTDLNDFFLPGSQPFQSGTLNQPNQCGCHQNYDINVEPYFNWQGSMMAHAARDPLYYATVSIANQDALQSGDLCIRCHSPSGWLEGRSTPTDGSALTASDRESVLCDFCHRQINPEVATLNPYPSDSLYTVNTYTHDTTYVSNLNPSPLTSANGMYIVDSDDTRRGPFTDPASNHQALYSPFHSDAYLCGTCHDVSNPVYTKDINGKYQLNDLGEPSPSFDPYTMFPVERTFSEWKMSSYNSPSGVYAPQFGGNKDTVSTCQDCHMRDITGKGCSKKQAPIRTDLPLHDMTGGNTFVPKIISSVFPGEVDQAALDSGISRATSLLQKAASLIIPNDPLEQPDGTYLLTVKVINETGHKLPSGYPEGRRIWINVKAYNSNDSLIYESGMYDESTGVLTHDAEIKVYEIKPGLSQSLADALSLQAGPSFHFVLNDTIYSDNRIPPRGFTNTNFENIQSPPVAYTYADGQYWDDTDYLMPPEAKDYFVTLYYQTTSKEYVEFLRDENVTDTWGTTMYNLWNTNGKSAPVIMQQFPGTIGIPVPVELISFNAEIKNDHVILYWKTATELNNYGFELERKNIDDWSKIGFIQGHGNSNSPKNYLFEDNQPLVGEAYYRLKQIDNDGQFKYSKSISVTFNAPTKFAIFQNYPNPFNPSTTIKYSISKQSNVSLKVFDLLGNEIVELINEEKPVGNYVVEFDASDLTSGIYFYKLHAGNFVETKKMILLK